jgi:hypothetical protein
MVVVLLLILTFGALGLAMTFSPNGTVSHWVEKASWFLPIAFILGVVGMASNRRRWNPDSPEVKAVMNDEWRRTSMDRALRASFVVVLLAQLPLALLFGAIPGLVEPWRALAQLPAQRAVIAMAVSTITLGMTTLAALFLYFDRD